MLIFNSELGQAKLEYLNYKKRFLLSRYNEIRKKRIKNKETKWKNFKVMKDTFSLFPINFFSEITKSIHSNYPFFENIYYLRFLISLIREDCNKSICNNVSVVFKKIILFGEIPRLKNSQNIMNRVVVSIVDLFCKKYHLSLVSMNNKTSKLHSKTQKKINLIECRQLSSLTKSIFIYNIKQNSKIHSNFMKMSFLYFLYKPISPHFFWIIFRLRYYFLTETLITRDLVPTVSTVNLHDH
mmetsp:Transcript_44924/g.70411  ORF Transcript_44924/g.70411 Transcript_44924/m.70411 type:complete len:240 (-) Transcript_44924:3409-4128(-)